MGVAYYACVSPALIRRGIVLLKMGYVLQWYVNVDLLNCVSIAMIHIIVMETLIYTPLEYMYTHLRL